MNKHSLKKFIVDEITSESVKEVLMSSFLTKRKDADVQLKAAQMIAIELLQEAWKELETYKTYEETQRHAPRQVGL